LILGLTGLSVGTVAAAAADIFPAHRNALQHRGGALLVGRLAVPFI
jgi:hypothetical protein